MCVCGGEGGWRRCEPLTFCTQLQGHAGEAGAKGQALGEGRGVVGTVVSRFPRQFNVKAMLEKQVRRGKRWGRCVDVSFWKPFPASTQLQVYTGKAGAEGQVLGREGEGVVVGTVVSRFPRQPNVKLYWRSRCRMCKSWGHFAVGSSADRQTDKQTNRQPDTGVHRAPPSLAEVQVSSVLP